MDLKVRIEQEMKAAMKDRDKVRVAAIRLIRDAIQKEEIDKNLVLDDSGVTTVLSRLKKQREDSIQAYEKGGRDDLAEREKLEIRIIDGYLPSQLTAQELEDLVKKAVQDSGAAGPKDMGKVMKALKGSYEGRASGKQISDEVKRQLSR